MSSPQIRLEGNRGRRKPCCPPVSNRRAPTRGNIRCRSRPRCHRRSSWPSRSRVLAFLQSGEYRQLGWCRDKGSKGSPRARHRAVRPRASITARTRRPYLLLAACDAVAHRWPTGPIPDGAMIIKEQYPAASGALQRVERRATAQGDRLDDHDQGFLWRQGRLVLGRILRHDDVRRRPAAVSISVGGVRACTACAVMRRPRRSIRFRHSTTSRDFPGNRSNSPTTAPGAGSQSPGRRMRSRRRSVCSQPRQSDLGIPPDIHVDSRRGAGERRRRCRRRLTITWWRRPRKVSTSAPASACPVMAR